MPPAGITFDPLADDVKLALANLKGFDKKAVVSGEEWVEETAEFVDKLFPGIEIRHFSPEERGRRRSGWQSRATLLAHFQGRFIFFAGR